jgi:hypothetical protein
MTLESLLQLAARGNGLRKKKGLNPSNRHVKTGTHGQACPSCGHLESITQDTRAASGRIRRRRCCMVCEARWTTYEVTIAEIEAEGREAQALLLAIKTLIDGWRAGAQPVVQLDLSRSRTSNG